MATAPKTPTRGGKFAAFHTRMLNATDLNKLSDQARLLFDRAILFATEQDSGGLIPADPFEIQMFTFLKGGEEACEAARDALLQARFLVPDPDGDDKLLIRAFADNQAAFISAGPTNPVASAGQKRRSHRLGGHPDHDEQCVTCHHDAGAHSKTVDEACELCPGTKPAARLAAMLTAAPAKGAPLAHSAQAHGEAPVQDTLVTVPALKQTPKRGRISEVVADVRESLDAAVPAAETPFSAYREALGMVEIIAANPDVASRSADARGMLLNAVLAHALVTYLGDEATQSVINAANRGAKTIGNDGHLWYLHAAAKASGRLYETERSLIGWLKSVASSSRSEQKAAA